MFSWGKAKKKSHGKGKHTTIETPARASVPSQVEKYSYNAIIQQKTDNKNSGKPNQTHPKTGN